MTDLYQVFSERSGIYRRELDSSCFVYTKEQAIDLIRQLREDWVRCNFKPDPRVYFIARVCSGLEEVE